jgi:hypothetical protein
MILLFLCLDTNQRGVELVSLSYYGDSPLDAELRSGCSLKDPKGFLQARLN